MTRYDEATEFIASIRDSKVRAGLEYALTTVLLRRGMSPEVVPSHDFDLRFFLEAVKAMFEDERVMRAILDGKDDEFRW